MLASRFEVPTDSPGPDINEHLGSHSTSSRPVSAIVASQSNQPKDDTDGHHVSSKPRTKTGSGDGGTCIDPEASCERNVPLEYLFNPKTDRITFVPDPRKPGKVETSLASRRFTNDNMDAKKSLVIQPSRWMGSSSPKQTSQRQATDEAVYDEYLDPDPVLVSQKETVPISREQLVVGIK